MRPEAGEASDRPVGSALESNVVEGRSRHLSGTNRFVGIEHFHYREPAESLEHILEIGFGKGTASAVPSDVGNDAALAAEGRLVGSREAFLKHAVV